MPGIPLVGGSSTVAGVSLLTLRERLARRLGYFVRGTVTTVASGLEAERYVISSTVRGDQRAPDHWDGHYLYVTNGDEIGTQRAIQNGTFEGPKGAFYLDEPFDDPLAAGTTFEVSILPAVDYLGLTGLNTCLNLGLHTLPVRDWVNQTVVADQVNYQLTGLGWQIKGVRSVAYPRTSTTNEVRRSLPPSAWGFENNAELPQIAFNSMPGNAGDVFEIEVLRPADTWIKTSGAWGDSAVGLVDDTDCCVYDANAVVSAAYPIALERLAQSYPLLSKERMLLEDKAGSAYTTAALTRWFGGQRGNGAQRVGATGGRRSWSHSWTP